MKLIPFDRGVAAEVGFSGIIERIEPEADSRLLYDRKEAARQLSISVRSLDYLIAGKLLETRRIGKKVLVTRASLRAFAAGNHYGSISTAARKEASSKCA